MFRFLAKSALASFVWRRYRHPIVASLLLLLGYFLVSMMHGDYVDYARGAGDTSHLWLSYLGKWIGFAGLTLGYYLYMRRALAPPKAVSDATQSATTGEQAGVRQPPPKNQQRDPFDSIRRKERLKTRADRALDHYKK